MPIPINHQFLESDFFIPNWECETLILGSFNPGCGERTDYFYGRPRNRFWRAMELCAGLENRYFQDNFNRKVSFLTEKKNWMC
mgnify:CR=1 FL=1